MKHSDPAMTFEKDLHSAVETPDFTALDRLYSGRCAKYGDYHAHSASGGTSDGKTTPEEWLSAMPALGIDFIGLMDHRQVRHQYLDCFTPEHFLFGTEPASIWVGDVEKKLVCHYLMIFPERENLETLLAMFPDVYEFEGGVEGHFAYKPITRKRFLEIKDAVLSLGGAFVNAHPMQQIESTKLDDFYFGAYTANEVIYTGAFSAQGNPHTAANYRLWTEMLSAGMKVYNTATADAHGAPTNSGVNTVYAAEAHCREYVKRLRAGDLNAGYIGLKMCIGTPGGGVTPMGGTTSYRDGMTLYLRADDAHPLLSSPDVPLRLDIHSDRGIVYSAPLTTACLPFSCAVRVEPGRKFYRAEIVCEETGAPAAIGNPIWMEG